MNLSIMVKNYKGKVCNMYQDEYKRWLAADLEDADLKPELAKVEGNDDEIKDRFAVALKFGTAGLRGVLGAGTNRMNIYVVRQATQGLANWVKTQGGNQTVAISYDSRLKSDVFAKTAAGVLAANGIKVRIYDALMPVPALSFATRYYECNAGIMVTASHNPAKYNGYKAYGPDGCQMTDDAAAIVYDEIQKTDVLTGAKYISFAEGVEQGLIRFVGDDCKNALYAAIEARQVRPGLCKTAGLKLVYSPLNGSGLVPVTHVLNDMGITDITITTGYLAEKLDAHFANGANTPEGVRVRCVRETFPMGTIGAAALMNHAPGGTTLVMNSDLLTTISFEQMYLRHIDTDADITIAAISYQVSVPFAILATDDAGMVHGIEEKPSYTHYANAGIYLISNDILDTLETTHRTDATDLVANAIAAGRRVTYYPVDGIWMDIGTPADFAQACRLMENHQRLNDSRMR